MVSTSPFLSSFISKSTSFSRPLLMSLVKMDKTNFYLLRALSYLEMISQSLMIFLPLKWVSWYCLTSSTWS